MRRYSTNGRSHKLRFQMLPSDRSESSDLESGTPSSADLDGVLARWLRADSLPALAGSAFEELQRSHRITQLLIVPWAGERRGEWVLFPPTENVIQIVNTVFGPSDQRALAHGDTVGGRAPIYSAGPPLVDPRLIRAGFSGGALVETKDDISYWVFWGEDSPERVGTVENAARTGTPPLQKEPVWHTLAAALDNMARLERLRELSHVDATTGIFNRRYFDLRLGEEIARARRFRRPLSLAVFDIDELKPVNDAYGHQVGDAVLRRTAKCARRATRSIDVFCRVGGDEFAILMPDADLTKHPHFGERLCSVLKRRHATSSGAQQAITITVSMGGAVFPNHCDDAERLVWCADAALLDAKQKGRGRFVLYDRSLGMPGTREEEQSN